MNCLLNQTINNCWNSQRTNTSVSFGDFYPQNSYERIICTFVMLMGVNITSLLLQNLQNIGKELEDYMKSNENLGSLGMFLSTIQKFNDGEISS